LPLLVDLSLDLELDLAQLLLLPAELLLLETHALGGKVFGQDGRVVFGVYGPGKLLSTVGFIQYIVSQGFEVREVRVEQSGAETAEVRVLGVIDFGVAPRVDTSTDELAVDLNFLLRANNGEGEEVPQLAVIDDGLFIVLFDIVREVVMGIS